MGQTDSKPINPKIYLFELYIDKKEDLDYNFQKIFCMQYNSEYSYNWSRRFRRSEHFILIETEV